MNIWCRALTAMTVLMALLLGAGCQQDRIEAAAVPVNFADFDATPAQVNQALEAALSNLNLTSGPDQPITGETGTQPLPTSQRIYGMHHYGEPLGAGLPEGTSGISINADVIELAPGYTRVSIRTLPENHPGIAQSVLEQIEQNLLIQRR